MDSKPTTIELTAADALLFVEFQKRYALMQLLDNIGAFAVKSGSVTIHFDALGAIANVEVKRHYKA